MKRILKVVAVIGLLSFLIGCQVTADLAGSALSAGLKEKYSNDNTSTSTPNLVTVTETGKYNIGKHAISVSDGLYGKNPCVIFETKDQNGRIKLMFFEKTIPRYQKMLNDFSLMEEKEKKQQIREWFIKYTKFDPGPVE